MSKRQERQRFLRHWQEVTGEKEIDMHKVAEFAKKMGWQMPAPPSEIDLLAKQFADDAKAEKGNRRYNWPSLIGFTTRAAQIQRATQSVRLHQY